jgi:hypothetical protein
MPGFAVRIVITLVFCGFILHSSINWQQDVVNRHYAKHPQTPLFYQALSLHNADALLQHYLNHPQWTLDKKTQWLSQAALSKDVRAHFELGKNWYQDGQNLRASLWLKSASNRGHIEARLLYGEVLIVLREFVTADKILTSKLLTRRPQAKISLAQLYLQTDRIDKAQYLLRELVAQNIPGAAKKLKMLDSLMAGTVKPNQCQLKVQFLVSGYSQLRYAADIMAQWQDNPSLNELSVCFNPTERFNPKLLDCSNESGSRMQCDLTLMAKNLEFAPNTLPVIVHGQTGVANYNNGIIFINHHKSYGVFTHELFHHFGFIDEYPLPHKLAEKLCKVKSPRYVGENLFVVPKQNLNEGLQQGMTKVDTCQRFDAVAFKPTKELTLMAFMDQPLPKVYLERARVKLLSDNHLMANYQYAYALAFDQKGHRNEYLRWLKLSAQQGYQVAKELLLKERGLTNGDNLVI